MPSTSDLNPPTTHPSLDHEDKAEKDLNKALLCNTNTIVEKPPCHVESELISSQATPPQADQTLISTQHHLSDHKLLNAGLEPYSVPSIYPSITACSEPQLLEGLLDSSLLPLASEASQQRQIAPAVLPLANQESSPPSLVPVEVADVERPKERLYPELPRSCQSVRPFTSEQLRTWEPGSWLENVQLHEAEFQSLAHQEGHELCELLLSYWRCRKQLTQAQTELQAANSDCKNVQNRLWSFKDERLSLQVSYFGGVDKDLYCSCILATKKTAAVLDNVS